MGGVRTGVGGGSRGKIGLGADVAGNCCRGPDLSFCGSPFPMGGKGKGYAPKAHGIRNICGWADGEKWECNVKMYCPCRIVTERLQVGFHKMMAEMTLNPRVGTERAQQTKRLPLTYSSEWCRYCSLGLAIGSASAPLYQYTQKSSHQLLPNRHQAIVSCR